MKLADKVGIVIPTHESKKLVKNYNIGPPKVGLIDKSINSLLEKVKGADKLELTICLNSHVPSGSFYQHNLQKYCDSHGYKLVVDYSPGYKGVRIGIPDWFDKEYLFISEYDWIYLEEIDLPILIEVFDNNKQVNFVRFNKRKNTVFIKPTATGRQGSELFCCHDLTIKEMPICMTPNYTNNPHVERLSKLREWIEIARNSCLYEGKNGGAGGFEHPLQEASLDCYERGGITGHNAEWGLYIYGALNDNPYVEHIGI